MSVDAANYTRKTHTSTAPTDDAGFLPPVLNGAMVTPKLMRKRKAEDETLPFSTTKK